MAKRKVRWMGSEPVRCELCSRRFTETDTCFYDFKTKAGMWAKGCESCFQSEGGLLGTGKGQKYDVKTRIKLEG